MIHLTIDDQPIEVPEGRSLLEACRENGIDIPTLCYHPALEPYGACRLCVVELSPTGENPAWWQPVFIPARKELKYHTETALGEKESPDDRRTAAGGCTMVRPKSRRWQELGVEYVTFSASRRKYLRPMRVVCEGLQGNRRGGAISMIERGMAKKVSAPFQVLPPAASAAVPVSLICPTGVLTLEQITDYHSPHRQLRDGQEVYLDCELCAPQRRMGLSSEKHSPHSPSRLGVVFCQCGGEISDRLDLEALRQEVRPLPRAFTACEAYPCSRDGQERVLQAIQQRDLDSILVAGCAPRLVEQRFPHQVYPRRRSGPMNSWK